jgi:Nif-specific regulatory protein
MGKQDVDLSLTPPPTLPRKMLLALVQASQWINGELKLDEVFDRIAQQAGAVLEAQGASVLLYDAARGELVFQSATGPGGGSLRGERIQANQGIAGQVVQSGRAVKVDDVRENRNFFPGIDAKTKTQTRSLMAAPMISGGEVMGVVEVLNPIGRRRFVEADLQLLQVFANLAATAARSAQAFERVNRAAQGLRESLPAAQIVGDAPAVRQMMHLCRKVAPTRATVLITGETGSGKELIARTIHDLSDRRHQPFIAVNCAALPETLLESELFGHEKGAFTGAAERKLGRFELADGGTLFLDELGEMNHATQVKLLRVLQEQSFMRVGGTQPIVCDVRILAATNRDLKAEVDSGRFRSDLFFRLNVFPIVAPPLRQRLGDLPALVDHFAHQVAASLGTAPPRVTPQAMACLMHYRWPGNIRELRNIIERCTLLSSGEITPADLPPEIAGTAGATSASAEAGMAGTAGSRLADQERGLILQALQDCGWNQTQAAARLGLSRDNLRYRVKKYGLATPKRG